MPTVSQVTSRALSCWCRVVMQWTVERRASMHNGSYGVLLTPCQLRVLLTPCQLRVLLTPCQLRVLLTPCQLHLASCACYLLRVSCTLLVAPATYSVLVAPCLLRSGLVATRIRLCPVLRRHISANRFRVLAKFSWSHCSYPESLMRTEHTRLSLLFQMP